MKSWIPRRIRIYSINAGKKWAGNVKDAPSQSAIILTGLRETNHPTKLSKKAQHISQEVRIKPVDLFSGKVVGPPRILLKKNSTHSKSIALTTSSAKRRGKNSRKRFSASIQHSEEIFVTALKWNLSRNQNRKETLRRNLANWVNYKSKLQAERFEGKNERRIGRILKIDVPRKPSISV